MHERLHWIGATLSDWHIYYPAHATDYDRGPCETPRYNFKVLDKCQHGICCQEAAQNGGTEYQATHNVDNYAYLYRNMALFWANQMPPGA